MNSRGTVHCANNEEGYMRFINKNELTVLVIALMLVTAGYLDYIGKNDTEETVVTETEFERNEISDVVTEENVNEEIAKIGDAKLVSDNVEEQTQEVFNEENNKDIEDSYFVSSKLERTNMYSQIIENYQKILENQNVSEEQRAIATQEISKINKIQNAIMIAENLLLAKGFDKSIVFVYDQSISVIIGKEMLEQEEIAQIQNIISRELKSDVSNIHISTK